MNAKIAVATALSSSISSSEVRTLNGCLITAYSVLQPFGWSSNPLIYEKATLALSGGVCLTICPSKSSTEDFVGRSSNGRYRRIVISGFNDITDTLSEHRTGQRRSVRNGSLGGIGFVLTDDSKGLLTAIVAGNRHGGTEMGADMAGIAMSALAVCAAAIPDKIQLKVKRHNSGWLESARLWVALVGPPSSMKSPIMAAAVRPLRRIDSEMARQYSVERARYDKLIKEEKAQTEPPEHTRMLLQDTTIEAAQEILKDSRDGVLCWLGLISSELG